MAQVKDKKTNAAAQQSIANTNSQLHNLLEERKQAITLAQSICPVYDKEDNFWTTVTDLTGQNYGYENYDNGVDEKEGSKVRV